MKIYEVIAKYKTVGYVQDLKKIQSPSEVFSYMEGAFDRFIEQEQFWIILLNSANRPIARNMITVGLVNQTQIHAREAFRFAIRENAVGVIFVHNHPSGNLDPSGPDIEVTKQLIKAGQVLDIQVLDHIIIADVKYNSIREVKPELFS